MCCKQLVPGDCALMDDSDGSDEHTEVGIIWLWKNTKKDARTQTIDVVQELTSFVTAR